MYKLRFISFDLQRYHVHLKYKFEDREAFESKHGDDEEKIESTDMRIEMFDIRKITNGLDIKIIRELINHELTNRRSSEIKPPIDYENIEADLQDAVELHQDGGIITEYNVEKSLYFRNKHSRFDNYQRNFLFNMIQNKDSDISEVSRTLRISKRVLYNLGKMRKYSPLSNINLLNDNTKLVEKRRLGSLIYGIVRKSTVPIKVNDIWQQLQNDYSVRAPNHIVLNILKRDLNCSYK